MRNRLLKLVSGCLAAALLAASFTVPSGTLYPALAASDNILVEDFETGTVPGAWGHKSVSVTANPAADDENNSANALECIFTEVWGRIEFSKLSFNPQTQAVALSAYCESMGDIFAYIYSGDSYAGETACSQSIFKTGWHEYYFDFSKTASLSSYDILQFNFGKMNTPVYFDNIRIVPLDTLEPEEEISIPYTYDNVAIGGGGFVSGIISCPTEKNLFYARTDVGGAYRWDESGEEWISISQDISEADQGLLSVESIAVDPASPNKVYMLAGCEYFSNQKTVIFSSEDYGETFTAVNVSDLIFAHGNGTGRQNGERLAVDPNNGSILFCGGRTGGLIKSTNGGRTWEMVTSLDVLKQDVKWPSWSSTKVKSTTNRNGINCVVFDSSAKGANGTERIFVSVSQIGTDNVYVSEDGGATWSPVPGLPTNYMAQRMKFDSDGNLLIAYADAEGPGNSKSGALYRYDFAAKTAENISPCDRPIGDVSVDAEDADRLVCTTISTWMTQPWGYGDRICTSTDGGKTWRDIIADGITMDPNGIAWIENHAIHWSGSIVMDPYNNNRVFVTSGNGVFATTDIWSSQPTFSFMAKGIEETVPLDLVSVPGGALYSAIGDYDGFVHTDVTEFSPIHKPEMGTTTTIAYAAKKPEFMVRAGGSSSSYQIYYTENAGETWQLMPQKPAGQSCYGGHVTISADGSTIYWSSENSSTVYYTRDKGASWSACGGISEAGLYLAADPENSNYIYGCSAKNFYVSADGGKTFTASPISNDGCSRICTVPGSEGIVYAPYGGGGLGVSTDYGKTFRQVPCITTCRAIGTGIGKTAADPMILYIWGKANGGAMGLYRSDDQGESWARINDERHEFGGIGNGQFVCGDNNIYGRVYISTPGLGLIYGDAAGEATTPKLRVSLTYTRCASAKPAAVRLEAQAARGSGNYQYQYVVTGPSLDAPFLLRNYRSYNKTFLHLVSVGTWSVTVYTKDMETGEIAKKTVRINYAGNEAPVISGVFDKTVYAGESFDLKAGITATDTEDGDLTARISVTGTVDFSTPGTYPLTYEVTDDDGKSASVTITITVKDPLTDEYPPYDNSATYNSGDKVSYQGKFFVCQYWTQGTPPASNNEWGPWKEVFPE